MRCLALAVVCWLTTNTAAGQMKTLLGTGQPGLSDTQLNNPFGIIIGPDKALYFTEYGNHVVRRYDFRTKAVQVIAGSGEAGYSGDGGPAVQAKLNMPHEVRVDQAGNIYIADTFNHAIRMVDGRTGYISTLAGNGKPGFSGDGGPGALAQLNQPHSLALDHYGNILICDTGNQRLRRLDLHTHTIETISGTGDKKPTPDGGSLATSPLFGPRTIEVAPAGDLYLALREGNQLFHIDAREAGLEWLGGTGQKGYTGDGDLATHAMLNGPKGLALAGQSLYVADTENHVIRRLDLRTGKIETVLGTGKPGSGASLKRPHGIFAGGDGLLYISDSENHRILTLPMRP